MRRVKAAAKKSAKNKTVKPSVNGFVMLTLENNVPLPARGERDPEFKSKVRDLLKAIKKGQSFVVPKPRLHMVKKIAGSEFDSYRLRSSIIVPDKKFARIWRTE